MAGSSGREPWESSARCGAGQGQPGASKGAARAGSCGTGGGSGEGLGGYGTRRGNGSGAGGREHSLSPFGNPCGFLCGFSSCSYGSAAEEERESAQEAAHRSSLLHARPVPSCPPRDVAAPPPTSPGPRHRGGLSSVRCGAAGAHMGAHGCMRVGARLHGCTAAWVQMFVGAAVGEKRLSEFPACGVRRGPAAPPSSRQTGAGAQQHFAASSVVLVPLSLCNLGVAAHTHTHRAHKHTRVHAPRCAHTSQPHVRPPSTHVPVPPTPLPQLGSALAGASQVAEESVSQLLQLININ